MNTEAKTRCNKSRLILEDCCHIIIINTNYLVQKKGQNTNINKTKARDVCPELKKITERLYSEGLNSNIISGHIKKNIKKKYLLIYIKPIKHSEH